MELEWSSLTVYSLAAAILLILIVRKIDQNNRRLPPCPPGLPIIGNLLQLGDKPHQSLFHLAQKHGPIMSLKLGTSLPAVVVSSPSMAREVLKDNDLIFSSKTITVAVRIYAYQGTTLVWSPYGPRWRLLRKICNTEIFSAKRLDALKHLRRDEVFRMVATIVEDFQEGKSVNIGTRAFMASLGLVGKMICGKDVFQPGSREAGELKETVEEILDVLAVPNLSDVFPFLERFDLQGLNRKVRRSFQRFDSMLDGIIKKRLTERLDTHKEEKDFLEMMLDLRKDGTEFSNEDIKGILSDMFIAGTETMSATVEWTLSELLINPKVMKKVQEEIDEVVGVERRMDEEDISKLSYLQAVVKEVMRLHPIVPLLLHSADKSCEIGGYVVPKNARLIVNVWGIGRDPSIWKDPLSFDPDRFMECNIDYKGHDFEFIPFGSGRRICIGLPLAHKILHLMLGSLLQAFNWSIPLDYNKGNIDMSEKYGVTLHKAVPLLVVPTTRLAKKSIP